MPAVPGRPGSRLPAAPLPQPKGAPAPPQLSGGGSRRGSGELPRAGRQDRAQPRARSRGEPPRGCRRAVPEQHFGAVSARCPPARRSPAGSPSRERRERRGPAAAPGSAAPLPPPGRCLRAPHPGTHGRPPPWLLSTGAYPFSLQSSQRSAAPLSAAALPAGRCSPAPAGARCPSGAGRDTRPGGGARAGGPGTDQGPNAAPGARHAWGPLSTTRAWGGGLRSQIWSEMALWKVNAPASLFGERGTEVKRLLLILQGEDVLQWIHYIALKNQNTEQTLIGFIKTPIFSTRK